MIIFFIYLLLLLLLLLLYFLIFQFLVLSIYVGVEFLTFNCNAQLKILISIIVQYKSINYYYYYITVSHTIHMMLAWRIWNWINK